MNRTKTNPIHTIWRFFLVLAILLPSFTPLGTVDVQAGGIPFLGIIPAMIKRNKVYREANTFIADRREYYDALRRTAAEQLVRGEIGGLRDSQWAAFKKVTALIEAERDSMYDFAEGEKKEARDKFITVVQDEITNVMLSTTPATRVLGAMSRGINSSRGFVEGILTEVSGGAGGVFEDLAKVRKWGDRLATAGGLIGGKAGEDIRKAGARISELASPTDSFEADLAKVLDELGGLGDIVDGLKGRGVLPTGRETAGEVIIHLVTGEPANPSIEAIADMLVAQHGGQGSIRDRAREIMLGNASVRCRGYVDQIRQVIFKMEIDPEAETEDPPEMFPVCETIDMTALVEEVAQEPLPTGEDGSGAESAQGQPTAEEATGTEAAQEQPTAEAAPEATGDASAPPPASEFEYIWVLASTTPNPNNQRTSFVGGVGDPEYFGEDRFQGKSLDFTASDGFFSVHAVDVDHGYTYADTTVSVNFDSPPAHLEPGQEITLSVSASHGGSVNEGGGGLGLIFQYAYLDRALEPIFNYLPYNPTWEGPSSQSYTFTAPIASAGGEFELWAGLWNSPPCAIVWKYQAQPNPNWTEAEAPAPAAEGEQASSEPEDTWKEAHCADLRQEVADKVPIARGADTADLALGVIGYLSAARGDIQVNYCEGGSGPAEKGTAIRVGDCIKTGPNGRGKITFNDRDDKYNAEPTTMYISRGSELCIPDFTVHRDDGKPGMIDMIRGAIRVITRGWQPGNSLGVDVSVRAAVTVASDVVLEYNPELDLLRTFVNEGSVSVTDMQTGQSQQLTDNELLITHQESIGAVEHMSSAVWKDLLDEQDLDAEESSTLPELANLSQTTLTLIGVVILVTLLGAGGVILFRNKKKTAE